jgi:hypothetical protein
MAFEIFASFASDIRLMGEPRNGSRVPRVPG